MPQLPEGFELDKKPTFTSLPQGFVIDKPKERLDQVQQASNRVEERQQNRQTPIEDFAYQTTPSKGIVGVLENVPFLPGNQSIKGVKQAIGLSGLAGRSAESAIAAPSLAAQRGDFNEMGPELLKGLSGQSKAEIGDVYYGAGVPEPVAKVAGLATDVLFGFGVDRLAKAGAKTKLGIKYREMLDKIGDKGIKIEKKVADSTSDYVRSVRPSVAKRNLSSKEYQTIIKDVKDVAYDIAENKKTLEYTDDFGDLLGKNRTPETLGEMTQAYEQRMNSIFNAYDEIQEQAGNAGAKVDTSPLINVYRKYMNPVKKHSNSALASEAQTRLRNLREVPEMTPKQTQDFLKDINKQMGSAWVTDRSKYEFLKDIQTTIMKQLDDAIESVGENSKEYFALRNKYRAYKNFQKDINQRAWVHGRRAFAQMPDMLNVFSAGDFMKGVTQVATGNAQQGAANILKAGIQDKAVKLIKTWNSPDFRTKKMFEAINESKSHLDELGKKKVFNGEIVERQPFEFGQARLGAQEQKRLPNSPKRPGFEGGEPIVGGGAFRKAGDDVIVPPNQVRSGVIRGESPEAVARRGKQNKGKTVYHGTNQEFDDFEIGRNTGAQGTTSKHGVWFTDSPEEATQYADISAKRNIPNQAQHDAKVRLLEKRISQAEKNRNFDDIDKFTQELEDLEIGSIQAKPSGQRVISSDIDTSQYKKVESSKKGFDQEKEILKAKNEGYAGVVFENIKDSPFGLENPTNQYLAFDISTIKKVKKSNQAKLGKR